MSYDRIPEGRKAELMFKLKVAGVVGAAGIAAAAPHFSDHPVAMTAGVAATVAGGLAAAHGTVAADARTTIAAGSIMALAMVGVESQIPPSAIETERIEQKASQADLAIEALRCAGVTVDEATLRSMRNKSLEEAIEFRVMAQGIASQHPECRTDVQEQSTEVAETTVRPTESPRKGTSL